MVVYRRRALKPGFGPRASTTSSNNSGSAAHGRSKGSAATSAATAAAAKPSASSSNNSSTTQHHRGGEKRRHSTATCKAEDPRETDPSMAQSFLPYCAHCEKQIVIPNNSILYCSEKCRRKDTTKPVPIPTSTSSASPYTFSLYSLTPPLSPFAREIPEPTRNIVQPLSPTPPSSSPPLHEYGARRRVGSVDNGIVEPPPSPLSTSPPSSSITNIYAPPRRPHHIRRGTSGSSSSAGMGIPMPQSQYQVNHRPLPPLRKPSLSSSSPRSIELVTPYLPVSQEEKEMMCEKKQAQNGNASGAGLSSGLQISGNLKMMFNFEALRSHPSPATTTETTSTTTEYPPYRDPYHRFAQRPITLK